MVERDEMSTSEEADRVAALEQKLAERDREIERLRRELFRFRMMVEHAPVGMFEDDPTGACTYVNGRWCEFTGLTPDEAMGFGWTKVLDPEDATALAAQFSSASGPPINMAVDFRVTRTDGQVRWMHGQTTAIFDESGQIVGYIGSGTDITERRRTEQELQRVQEELEQRVEERTAELRKAAEVRAELEAQVIASQESLIRELSTPLMPIADGVLAMPLVGSISAERAEGILEALLAGVSASGAQVVILDITGVPMVDTHAADALMRAARATRLLGAEVIVTGIGPAVAQTLIELDVGLNDVVTRSTLQAGIAHALRRVKGR